MSDDMGGYRQINKSLNICAFEEYLKGQAAQIPHLDSVEQLSPRVLRVLGANAGKVSTMNIPGIKSTLTSIHVVHAPGNKHLHPRDRP